MITLAILGATTGGAFLAFTWAQGLRKDPDVYGDGWALVDAIEEER